MKNSLTLALLSKDKLQRAIAWGRKSHDSMGYTDSEIIAVLKDALNTIKALEEDLITTKRAIL